MCVQYVAFVRPSRDVVVVTRAGSGSELDPRVEGDHRSKVACSPPPGVGHRRRIELSLLLLLYNTPNPSVGLE